jgi:NusA-like KH domain protein
MTKTFDMQFIRYINLFGRVTRVTAKHCFSYNNTLVFIVARNQIEQSIGKDNSNLRKLSEILGKRIRVIAEPHSMKDLKGFVSVLVSPIKFDSLEIVKTTTGDEEVLIKADLQGRSMLIGRNKARLEELKQIIEQYFEIKNVRIG